jgi:hypothetical protein
LIPMFPAAKILCCMHCHSASDVSQVWRAPQVWRALAINMTKLRSIDILLPSRLTNSAITSIMSGLSTMVYLQNFHFRPSVLLWNKAFSRGLLNAIVRSWSLHSVSYVDSGFWNDRESLILKSALAATPPFGDATYA